MSKISKSKYLIICAMMLLLLTACGDKTDLKSSLDSLTIESELPPVSSREYSRLSDVDDEVYEQQLAACEMYIEAYEMTKPADYIKKYKNEVSEDRVEYYCNSRRKELQNEIGIQLSDNVYELIKSVDDCSNKEAYLDRVNKDATLFYDYYAEYLNSDDEEKALCDILSVFHERSNVLAFRFMDDNKSEIINAAVRTIEDNAEADTDLNMYIAMNNELVRALNNVYGGVNRRYADRITKANTELARKLLETDETLSEEEIQKLMEQLSQSTPEPSESAEESDETEASPSPVPSERPTPSPTRTPVPTQRPARTPAPAQTTRPTSRPAVTLPPATPAPTQTPDTSDEEKSYTLTS